MAVRICAHSFSPTFVVCFVVSAPRGKQFKLRSQSRRTEDLFPIGNEDETRSLHAVQYTHTHSISAAQTSSKRRSDDVMPAPFECLLTDGWQAERRQTCATTAPSSKARQLTRTMSCWERISGQHVWFRGADVPYDWFDLMFLQITEQTRTVL